MIELINKITSHLTPDLLRPQYREGNKTNPLFGHCYVATEVLYHLLNDGNRYHVYHGKDDDGIVHWWLVDSHNNEILDPTKGQYTIVRKVPPYAVGKRGFFLTTTPSKRANILLSRMIDTHEESHNNHDRF